MSTNTLTTTNGNDSVNGENTQTVPALKIPDSQSNEEESVKQKKDEKVAQNGLHIQVPQSTSPQLVSSPIDIAETKTPESEVSPTSTSPPPNPTTPTNKGDMFKNVSKIIGSMIGRHDSSANASVQNTTSEQKDAATSDSTVQIKQEETKNNVADKVDNVTSATPASPESIESSNNNDDKTADAARSAENNSEGQGIEKQDTPEAAVNKRMNSIINVKMFIKRTPTVLVEKLKEKFDELDKRIYPPEDEEELSRGASIGVDETIISEREQLLENGDDIPPPPPPKDYVTTNGVSQTKDVLAEVGEALNERQEKLENISDKTESLRNNASSFAEMAKQLSKRQEQKNKSWKFWA
ncbi:1265_t:CDS:2 [Funneliformis geosporum]|uniref:15501_t:CDS:1 n=1 Tax=Funneliformis geosporum TaxID=1117311 RepID=A0A9W4SR20_9GLOM|nr:1265_t:CDS:2 [Funneliformis geosporum]CAI2176039.1 15501_t:CDS:2 [Funneliformis geosporum]